jgi:hypothetical protein
VLLPWASSVHNGAVSVSLFVHIPAVTHQYTLITSKRSDPRYPGRGRSLFMQNPGFPVEVGDVTCSMRFSLKKTAHAAFSSAACRKSGKHDSMRLG